VTEVATRARYNRILTALQRAELESAIWTDPHRMSGTPCFRNTRVPIQSLIDFLESGETVDELLALYPAVTRQQIVTVLDFANRQLIECASSLVSRRSNA
jgi:uncharacterized protein (DUF433 family)